ncbi:hypothetical protein [Streptomyces sp. NPDC046985]|uniref:hypothetical protein n=1 Tax=Streptomyces sp. NPDC046985 TaxID=3155377 RepID=UPI0033E910E2
MTRYWPSAYGRGRAGWRPVVSEGGCPAGATAAVTAVQEDGVITTGEDVAIALAVLGAWGISYAVPNRPKTGA